MFVQQLKKLSNYYIPVTNNILKQAASTDNPERIETQSFEKNVQNDGGVESGDAGTHFGNEISITTTDDCQILDYGSLSNIGR